MLHLSEATRPVRGHRLTWPEETAAVSAGCPARSKLWEAAPAQLGKPTSPCSGGHVARALLPLTCPHQGGLGQLQQPPKTWPAILPARASAVACNHRLLGRKAVPAPGKPQTTPCLGKNAWEPLHHTTCHGTSPRLLVFLTTETTPVYLRFKGRAFQK